MVIYNKAKKVSEIELDAKRWKRRKIHGRLVLMVQIKFGQKLLGHFFKILTFWYHSQDHFKNVNPSTSSLIFAKFSHSVN